MNVKAAYSIVSIRDCNFWQIPKCGTTTVKHEILKRSHPQAVRELDEVCRWLHHVKEFRFITPKQANSNEKYNFTFVRSPLSRFESLYKDVCLHRKIVPSLFGATPEDLLSALAKAKAAKGLSDMTGTFRNVHLRPISYFLKEFRGDVFNIDDLHCTVVNHRKETYSLSPELKKRVELLWEEDFGFLDQTQDIARFSEMLEGL